MENKLSKTRQTIVQGLNFLADRPELTAKQWEVLIELVIKIKKEEFVKPNKLEEHLIALGLWYLEQEVG